MFPTRIIPGLWKKAGLQRNPAHFDRPGRFSMRSLCGLWASMFVFAFCGTTGAGTLPPIKTVFVIVMENQSWWQITGTSYAPYINNTLLPMASSCNQYYNNLIAPHPSEPNYIWLESGTNFGLTTDLDPTVNHISSTNHLVSLLNNVGISWKVPRSASSTAFPCLACH